MSTGEVDILLGKLQEITEEAVQHLDQWDHEEFTRMTETREEIMKELQLLRSEINDQHREMIQNILGFDSSILRRMHQLKDEAGEWTQKQGVIRVQQNAYHQSYMIDGLFIDQRK